MLLKDEEMLKVFLAYDSDFDYVGGTEGDIAWCVAKAQLKKVFIEIDKVYNSEDPQLALAYLHKALSEEVRND